MSEVRQGVLEQLAQQVVAGIVARVGRSWRWRLAVGAAAAAAAVVVAGALAGSMGR